MVYRNSIVTPGGYLYNVVVLGSLAEIYGRQQPECIQDGEGVIILYNDILIDAYGPDREFDENKALHRQYGYTPLAESTFGYFTWTADEEIHINHTSPYIYFDSTGGAAATEGMVITKIYTPQAGDVSPFQGTAITAIQSTASINAVGNAGGESWFEGCTYLREVVMHNATFFGANCFKGCTSLQWMDIASKCTFGADCFLNAGAYRGVISAASVTTLGEPWVLTDLPSPLRSKGWKIINHDGSELSDYWEVGIDTNGLTVTANPAWTTLGTLESNFAAADTSYALTVSGFAEGQSLQGWYYSDRIEGYHFADTSNPRSFTFTNDCYIVPLTEIPQEDPEPEQEIKREDIVEPFEKK